MERKLSNPWQAGQFRGNPPGMSILIPLIIFFAAANSHAYMSTSDSSSTTITITWTAPGDDGIEGTASQYDIRYSTSTITEANWDQASQVTGEPSPQPAGSQESFTVTELEPNTTYYFAIKTVDEALNWSGLSNNASGTTGNEEIAPAVIENLLASNPTGSSITLTWTAPGDDVNEGTASEYDIRYSTSIITEANWNSAIQVTGEPSPQPAGNQESFTVSGLASNTTYYFAIKTADEVPNWSGLSNNASELTSDIIPPAAIDNLQAFSGDSIGDIEICWTAPGDDSLVGMVSNYIIKTSTELITDSTWDFSLAFGDPPAPMESGSLQTWTITGLEPGQLYYVAMKSVDDFFNVSGLSNVDSAVAKFNPSNVDNDIIASLPAEFSLAQNYPNPFNPSTNISFGLPQTSYVLLEIFDTMGKRVATLADQILQAGVHICRWDGSNSSGYPVTAGVYFCRLQADNFIAAKKMVLIK